MTIGCNPISITVVASKSTLLSCTFLFCMAYGLFDSLVPCTSLSDPNNGVISCSLGNDEAPSYEDTCSFTCNTGYELTGSDTRTCQSDGSWSGSDDVCGRGVCVCVCVCVSV